MIELPFRRMSPSVGLSKPAIIRSVVVFPQPEGPRKVTNSPLLTSRSVLKDLCDPVKLDDGICLFVHNFMFLVLYISYFLISLILFSFLIFFFFIFLFSYSLNFFFSLILFFTNDTSFKIPAENLSR